MKNLKKIAIALALIAVLAGIGIYFMPNHYSISNSIEINKPVDVVYAQLNDFNKWGSWDPWRSDDPNADIKVEGQASTRGHKMSWSGEKIGVGSLTINWCSYNKSITNDLQVVKPHPFNAKDLWNLEADGNKTKVTWTNAGGLKYPIGRVSGTMVDRMINQQQKRGLDNLKKYCESLEVPAPVASADSSSSVEKSM